MEKSTHLCECGCGQFTSIAIRNDKRRGVTKGQPRRFIEHHSWKQANDAARTHGYDMSDATYRSWVMMRQRCLNPRNHAYDNYGGRGITICDRWHDFANFLEDMGPRPKDGTIERDNVNKGYEPGNCHWIARSEQPKNTRTNFRITFRGETKHLAQWAREVGIHKDTLQSRLRKQGWSVKRALTTPTR